MKHLLSILLLAIVVTPTLPASESSEIAETKRKLETIRLPDVKLDNVPLTKAIADVCALQFQIGPEVPDENQIVRATLDMDEAESEKVTITMDLKTPTLGDALAEIAKQAKCELTVHPNIVAFVAK